jgi:hypothetical protein
LAPVGPVRWRRKEFRRTHRSMRRKHRLT